MNFIEKEIQQIDKEIYWRYEFLSCLYELALNNRHTPCSIINTHNKVHQLLMKREKCIKLLEVYFNDVWYKGQPLKNKYMLSNKILIAYNEMMWHRSKCVVKHKGDSRKVEKARLQFIKKHTLEVVS